MPSQHAPEPHTDGRDGLGDDRLPPGAVLTLAVLLSAAFVAILNETVLNVAFPHLIDDLGVTPATVQWLATGFMLTMAVVIPTTGFILSRLTTRGAFVLAMGAFTLGTLICALAPNFGVLLTGRIVQGFGTAITMPLMMTTILGLVPVSRRGQVMGNVTIVIAVAPALGPTVSGLILSVLPWRFLFIFVLPFALAALTFGVLRLGDHSERDDRRLDVLSACLSAPGFGGLVYGLSSMGKSADGVSPTAVGAVVAGALCVALFVLRQLRLQRAGGPLLDMRVFRYRDFSVAVVLLALTMAALFGTVVILPMFMQTVRGFDTITTGLVLLPGGLLMGLLGPVVGRLFDRVGARPLTLVGTSLLVAVNLFYSFALGEGTPVWTMVACHIVFSLGLSLIFTPVFTASLNPLTRQLHPHGSAILSTLQQVAAGAGTALLVGVMQLTALSVSGSVEGAALMPGVSAAFRVAAVIAGCGLATSLLLRSRASTLAG